jgi:ATP-binding cassette subfamily B protein
MEEEVLGKAYDARLMRRLLRYMRPYTGLIAVSVVVTTTHAAGEMNRRRFA